ncbi:MAG: aspartate aminotransferase family protein [Acutalibacteraceae bacterium]|nr:aspartate aminotransferase family protein [Acutalibacteraceae bacterium]
MTLQQIKDDDNQNIMHTYGRFNVALVKGKGATAWDESGKEYIDFTSGIGVNCLGYCDDGWAEAVSKQASTLQHISNLYYSPLQTELAKKLCKITGFSKVFFANSGAEANECAIKLARKYSFEKYGQTRTEIITLENSFHGRTVTTLAATGQEVFHNYFFPFTEGFSFAKANDMASVKEKVNKNTCAVMIELVQGEGGVNPLEKAFVKELADYCKEKDLLLIIDEVQTGVGRTGTFYCYEQFGIQPDIISSAKGLGGGLPMGACLCTEKLAEVMSAGTHGTTYGGNPIACAGATEVINRVAEKEFLEDVAEKGKYMRKKLSTMEGVKEVRGLGMMIGVVLEKDNAKEVATKCTEKGLLVLTAKTLIRFLPPLTITKEEIDKGLDIFKNIIK